MSWREIAQRISNDVTDLTEVDTTEMSAVELSDYTETLHRLERQTDHARHLGTARLERSGKLLDLGYRTPAQWQRHKLHRSSSHAGRVATLARTLTSMPTVTQRWAAGDLDADHARALAALRSEGVEHIFDEAEPHLADQAATTSYDTLKAYCRRWQLRVDPDGNDPAETDRDAHVSTTFEGATRIDGTLGPIDGAIFKDTFDDIVEEFFHADWAEAKARLARKPQVCELRRSPAQRRADAIVEMATRARSYDNHTHHRARPLVTIIAGLDAIAHGLAHLWDNTPLSASQLATILAQDPDVQRYVYGPDEAPIRYNPRHRFYTGKLRDALQTRDRHCTGLGCDLDTRHGAIDHIHPVDDGGQTTPTNGRATCHPCNRSRPRRRFTTDTPTTDPTSPDHDGTDPP